MEGSEALARRFGANLARERKRAGLSQEEVGYRASLHRTEIGLLERGERTPRIDTALKLAGALEVGVDELVEGIEWSPGSVTPGGFSLPSASAEGS
jgi:transcriptional regulator with XRE-family HTH domain